MTTIAIILGASEWPKSPQAFPGSTNFANSARVMTSYLTSASGLGLPNDAILDLFDSELDQGTIDATIESFISDRMPSNSDDINIIIYFTGHGAFTEGDRQYCFALRSSRAGKLHATGYRIASLAHTLNFCAGSARRFLIFDACFAAAAHNFFMPQSAAGSQMTEHSRQALVRFGTALLSAASSADFAVIPAGGAFTMFSEALFDVLRRGSERHGDLLCMDDIQDLIVSYVQKRYRSEAVRPELSVPDQRWGDLASVGLFPNRAKSQATSKLAEVSHPIQKKAANVEQLKRSDEDMLPPPAPLPIAGSRTKAYEAARVDSQRIATQLAKAANVAGAPPTRILRTLWVSGKIFFWVGLSGFLLLLLNFIVTSLVSRGP